MAKYSVSMRVEGRVYVVVDASSFEEAFEKAKAEPFDPTKVDMVDCRPVSAMDGNGTIVDYDG